MEVVVSRQLLGNEGEADLSAWRVEDGASVSEGQTVAEIETAKARVEITAPATGTLKIMVQSGTVIEADTAIAKIV